MMNQFLILSCILFGSLHGLSMQEFLGPHVPMNQDGKIYISPFVRHIKIDIGLSYSAPMSQQWLSHESDLVVFGFEPHPTSVATIKAGAIKLDPSHGEPLNPTYVGSRFFVIPCALGLKSGEFATFYITKESCGCSSLYPPKHFEVEKVIDVPSFRLSDFFDLFPFNTHPVIDYIKIDAQGSDLDIVKSAGNYLQDRVVYITIEPENDQYQNTVNSEQDVDSYMRGLGFVRDRSQDTADPTYFNPKFSSYIQRNRIKIFQKG